MKKADIDLVRHIISEERESKPSQQKSTKGLEKKIKGLIAEFKKDFDILIVDVQKNIETKIKALDDKISKLEKGGK